jgi:hypothetical protein
MAGKSCSVLRLYWVLPCGVDQSAVGECMCRKAQWNARGSDGQLAAVPEDAS